MPSHRPPDRKQKERRARLGERNDAIRAYYKKEWARGFRNDKIIKDLTEIYHLDMCTLEAIVFRKGVYKDF